MRETEIFGKKLKELRTENGVSMKQLANAIEASDAAVCKWENGISEPKASYVAKLAQYFNCTSDFLLGLHDDWGVAVETGAPALNEDERRLARLYRQLSPEMKKLLLRTASSWVKEL